MQGKLVVELAEYMDADAEVAGIWGRVQGIPGLGFDMAELASVIFRAALNDDNGAVVLEDLLD